MTHLDVDALVSIEEATGWSAAAAASHLATCVECRSAMQQLEDLGRFRETVVPDADFGPRVAASIRASAAQRSDVVVPRRSMIAAWQEKQSGAGMFLVASAIAWLAIQMGTLNAAGGAVRAFPLGSSILVAAIAGLVVTWHSARTLQPVPAT